MTIPAAPSAAPSSSRPGVENIVPIPQDRELWTPLVFEAIDQAADALRRGELVAFPTETVYGLGGLATDPAAVARIFAAKQRPATNPLIVHAPTLDAFVAAGMVRLSGEVERITRRLAQDFWPGPLTLIVPRGPAAPDILTAGSDTVAIRVPDHAVALELLRRTAGPVAAPSANQSTRLSPTQARHVVQSLNPEDIEYILDGGPCAVGIESTVVDITDPSNLRVLRPGIITPSEIANRIGQPVHAPDAEEHPAADQPARSPGTLADHYQPRIPLVLVGAEWFGHAPTAARDWILIEIGTPQSGFDPDGMLSSGNRTFQLTLHPPCAPVRALIQLPGTAEEFSRELYAALHVAQESGVTGILVGPLPEDESWLAVRDRLRRAATKNRRVIEVVGGILPWHY